ncbi:MAG: DUF2252 family protein [Acidobacteriota bacterium]|nr:DUF2252 family protein [Acidobacteriota bacterium]
MPAIPRIAADPPLTVPIDELAGQLDVGRLEQGARELLTSYLRSLPRDRRRLVERYRYADLARKVVGVAAR